MNHQHEHQHPAGASAKPGRLPVAAEPLEKDPVCGMDVPADAPLRSEYRGKTYHFCGQRCLDRFNQDPGKFVGGTEEPPRRRSRAPAGPHVQWTCPMHPQIVRDAPGSCPICGMALEPRDASAPSPGRTPSWST